MSVIGSNVLAGASGQAGAAGYAIERSLRFNGSVDSSYLNRTPSSAGNRKTWTWSGWVKRSGLDTVQALFGAGQEVTNDGVYSALRFLSDNTLNFRLNRDDTVLDTNLTSTAVFRDTSAWYHIVLAWDSTQSTDADRAKIYVNGVQLTDFNTPDYPGQNTVSSVNNTKRHTVGAFNDGGSPTHLFDGYLADVHFIDGQALAASDFGEPDDNGVWQPKAYAGSYGTNGFKLNFSDNSSNAALGTDSSGNSNTWTVNNLVADGGVVYSNYVSGYINSLGIEPTTNLFDGNTSTSFYSSNISGSGIKFVPTTDITGSIELYLRNGDTANSTFSYSLDNGSTFTNLTTTSAGGYVSIGSQTIGNVNGIIVRHVTTDGTNSVNWRAIRVDGTVLTDGTPSNTDSLFDSPTNGTQTDTGLGGQVSGNYATLNPLAIDPVYALPTLSEGNLTAVASSSGSFATITFGLTSGKYYWEFTCGSNVSSGSTSRPASGFNKVREVNSTAFAWRQNGNTMGLSGSPTFSTYQTGDIIGIALDIDNTQVTFYKNGVQQGSGAYSYTNTDDIVYIGLFSADNGGTYHYNFGQRAFAFAPSGFKALNTANLPDPTIADGSDYMDVVTYTATGGTAQSIAGLEFNPDLVWLKARVAGAHNIFDSVRGATKGLRSNDPAAEYTDSETLTSFDSNGFSLGPDNNGYQVNFSNNPMVGWTWDAGHPATAATGAVSFDGTGDYLSLPASSDFNFGSGDFTIEFFWHPTSTSRQALYHGSFGADYSIGIDYNSVGTNKLGFWASSNGTTWDIVNADGGGSGITTGEPIQNAWNHIAYVRNGNSLTMYLNGGSVGSITSTATISLADTDTPVIGAWWNSNTAMSDIHGSISNFRILKGTALYTSNYTPPTAELTNVTNTKLLCCQSTTSATAAAVTPGTITANGNAVATTFNPLDAFSVNGTGYATTSAAGITEGTIALTGASVNQSAGFSIVSYTGTGAAGTVGHGLNAAPKIVIFKNRDAATNWRVYTTMVDGSMDSLFLNTTAAKTDSSLSAFTSSVFYCGTNPDHNGSGQAMIAYCFAPVEGYSAFGSYTASSALPFIYTGFKVAFLMIKNISSASTNWRIMDSTRDILNDGSGAKWLKANSSNAEVDERPVDLLSNGFKMRMTDGGDLNYSTDTFIYAAFAETPFKYARAR